MNAQFKTLIIDDEQLALKRLRRLLEKYPGIHVVAEASNGKQGLQLSEEHKPDLIFLDVEMPEMNGFEMLGKLSYDAKIIFTTAFEEYAIKAFEENSIDYLLKPIEIERLDKAIEKLIRFQGPANPAALPVDISALLKQTYQRKEIKSIPVKIGDRFLLIKLEQVVYFEARDKFVYIITDENREYLTDFTIAHLEEKLAEPFLRVHRAFIVNSEKIRELHKGFNSSHILVMKDARGTRINTGRSYLVRIKHLFEF